MALNFPMGKIFLGDGGAYALGHLLVWSSIILITMQPTSAMSFSLSSSAADTGGYLATMEAGKSN